MAVTHQMVLKRIQALAKRPEDIRQSLGMMIVTPDGDGLYSNATKAVPVEVVVRYGPDIERTETGEIDFMSCDLRIYYQSQHWDNATDGRMYTDDGVETQVNDFLESLGYGRPVGWSESGMQGDDFGHFDIDYEGISLIFPEVELVKTIA
jgi:hypothetical protein